MNGDKYTLIIDDGPLLEIKPNKPSSSILDYAKQLLLNNALPECQYYDRIDIIFDSHKSKQIKSFTKCHPSQNKQHDEYNLTVTDILDSAKFQRFVHTNRSKLASVIRRCWSEDQMIDLLSVGKPLIIVGPENKAIKLTKRNALLSSCSCNVVLDLECDHVEADTRLFLHVYDVQVGDHNQKSFTSVVIQSNDTDVTLLSIAHHGLINIQSYYIKKVNNYNRTFTFINIKTTGKILKEKWSVDEPNILLTLYSISGCDTTSFIRYVIKRNLFSTYLSNTDQFQDLLLFGTSPNVKYKCVRAAEKLVLLCYSNKSSSFALGAKTLQICYSLDSLRKVMAIRYLKNNSLDISIKLPSTSNSFYQRCLRCWRQTYTWKKPSNNMMPSLFIQRRLWLSIERRW